MHGSQDDDDDDDEDDDWYMRVQPCGQEGKSTVRRMMMMMIGTCGCSLVVRKEKGRFVG